MSDLNLKYLKKLAQSFPTKASLIEEIASHEANLCLPKGAELFVSDIHGEYEAFQHMLRNGSGLIKKRIEKLFCDSLTLEKRNRLATIIYYPESYADNTDIWSDKLDLVETLIVIADSFSNQYGRRKISRLIAPQYKTFFMELLSVDFKNKNKSDYYKTHIESIIKLDVKCEFIITVCKFIQRSSIHRIHIIGDIYDRGPAAEKIMDELIELEHVDIQWGNHDIVWMGAAAGSLECIANVIRLSLRYGNTSTLENGYGIDLISLASFALENYKEDTSAAFNPKIEPEELLNESQKWLNRIMHKAISVIQFKLEDQLIERRPEFNIKNRVRLSDVDFEVNSVNLNGKDYPLEDEFFPTIDPLNQNKLTEEELILINNLKNSFLGSARLQEHVEFLYQNGSLFKCVNNSLLYHGCIPLGSKGELLPVDLNNMNLKGKEYLTYLDTVAREAFYLHPKDQNKQAAIDMMWYLWCGPYSPVFGKDAMRTFERYFIKDKSVHIENKSYYYQYRDNEEVCRNILSDFNLDESSSIIINGHVPVEVKKGENPIKANGKLFVIDGGFAKAYQQYTGIGGYSLISDETGVQLMAQEPFTSKNEAIKKGADIVYSESFNVEVNGESVKIADTDNGKEISEYVDELKLLLKMYNEGKIVEGV